MPSGGEDETTPLPTARPTPLDQSLDKEASQKWEPLQEWCIRQNDRASGLNVVTAALVLWNAVDLECAINESRERGQWISDNLLAHLSPLGWEPINLTGDYVWKPAIGTEKHPIRQLRLPIGPDRPNP